MDPKSFYSGSSRKLKSRPTSTLKTFEIYSIFKTQKEAFDYSDSRGNVPNLAIFSFEFDKSKSGIRKFLVTTLHDFWARYRTMPVADRHYYELIRENQNCHLYFDLEFEVELNPNSNGPAMVEILKGLTLDRMETQLNALRDRVKIIELYSSSSSKFSRHLVFKSADGWCFRNNQDVGFFVNSMVEEWKHKMANDKPVEHIFAPLFVMNKKNELEPFVDTGVYSKNRNFRIWGSSKIGKDHVLEIHGAAEQFETFKSSLVGDYDKLKLHFNISQPAQLLQTRLAQPVTNTRSICQGLKNNTFPLIECFILSSIIRDEKASVQSTVYYESSKTLIVVIRGNRFCNWINRQHRSNQVYYVVNLTTGEIFQRCFDPECSKISFPVHSLPNNLTTKPTEKSLFDEIDDSVFAEIHIDQDSDSYLFDEIEDSIFAKMDV